jgi:hypothetical protein
MSNLNSVFDTLRGWPGGSALEASFEPDFGVTLAEGSLVYTSTRQLADAAVFHLVDDSLVTSPTLTAADAGNAYIVAGVGGAWSGFGVGDLIYWTGAAWVLLIAAVEEEPVSGTRAVVIDASAAGSFAGLEDNVVQYTKHTVQLVCTAGGYTNCVAGDIGKPVVATGSGDTGHLVSYNNTTYTWIVDPDTPADVFQAADALAITGGTGVGIVDAGGVTPLGGTWAAVAPDAGARIKITSGFYSGKYYEYSGTAWYKAARQKTAPTIAKALTSGVKASSMKDDAWMVIQGNDQYDGNFANKVTAIKLMSGSKVTLACTIANTLAIGDNVCANAGVLKKLTSGAGMEWPLGVVVASNNTAGASGVVTIATY